MRVLVTGATGVLGREVARAAVAAGHSVVALSHSVHVSIAGIDDIPIRYYRAKRAAEHVVMGGGLPFSILRATQFHHFVDEQLRSLAAVPLVMPLPKAFVVQSVDVREVAARLVRCLNERPRGRLAEFGGPHVLPLTEAAATWMRVNRVQKPIVNVPVPGKAAAALRAQKNTAPFGERGKVSWREWLLGRGTMSPIDARSTAGLERQDPPYVRGTDQPPVDIRRVS